MTTLKFWSNSIDKRGIKINHGMGVTKFYYDPATNTVVGVQVGEGDKAKNVKANKGVIMATGGITGTPQSLDRWVPSVAGKGVAIGGPKNDGTAMMVAVRDVGVPLSHMQYIASYPCGIVVNGRNGPYCRWWFITNNGGILSTRTVSASLQKKKVSATLLRPWLLSLTAATMSSATKPVGTVPSARSNSVL